MKNVNFENVAKVVDAYYYDGTVVVIADIKVENLVFEVKFIKSVENFNYFISSKHYFNGLMPARQFALKNDEIIRIWAKIDDGIYYECDGEKFVLEFNSDEFDEFLQDVQVRSLPNLKDLQVEDAFVDRYKDEVFGVADLDNGLGIEFDVELIEEDWEKYYQVKSKLAKNCDNDELFILDSDLIDSINQDLYNTAKENDFELV